MAPILRLAASLAALAGLALADDINWNLLDAAGPATGFELAPVLVMDISNYTTAIGLGNSSIRAPLDCKSQDTYLGQQVFTDGPLSITRCADACSAQRAYDAKHTNKKRCRFFNTYTLLKVASADKKGVPLVTTPAGQVCSLYSETWAPSFGTDKGQWRGGDLYVIADSYAASYASDPSSGECPAEAAPSSTGTPKATITPAPTSSGLITKTITTTTTTSK
ncbi:hypothetical protein PG993_008915 [Apiospora rasikravindrae]|uniref:Secreted protein n=1 Tax=Apiospora rasikravindrae TaxID=990691 RepID=A0ABR1SPP2_9PEZI